MQTSALAAVQAYGFFHHGACLKSQLYPHHRSKPAPKAGCGPQSRLRPPKQVATPEERRPAGFCRPWPPSYSTSIRSICQQQYHRNLHEQMTWQSQGEQNDTAAFHLHNREARHELTINVEERAPPFSTTPTYLSVKLDRALTFRQHLESLRKKLTTRAGLLRRLVGSSWGAGAIALRTATLALVYSTTEYCAPVSCRNAHTRLIDSSTNDALRLVTGCLRPTPTDDLYALAGIQPSELRRKRATLSLARRGQNPKHVLLERLLSSPYGEHRQLKSRRPFVPAALDLLNDADALSTSAAGSWVDHK